MGKITDRISKQIDALDGNVYEYAKIVQHNKNLYVSLNKNISSRLKVLNKETKAMLAKRLGVRVETVNGWEQKGMTKEKDAFELAIALKVEPDKIEDFIQKGTGRGIYAATQTHYEYLYILYHREELENKYPYEKDETVRIWVDRVKKSLPIMKTESSERKETELFKVAAKEGAVDVIHVLPFRNVGEKANAYLDDYIKGTIFELYYGNKNTGNVFEEVIEEKDKIKIQKIQEKNPSFSNNLFLVGVKKKLSRIKDKLKAGEIPHRYEMIKLGMDLRMSYQKMNELLELCGEHPLYSRNIYEGALLSVWKSLSEVYPEWFEEKDSHLYVADIAKIKRTEAIFEDKGEYQEQKDLGGPIDFMVLASQQVEKALANLPPKMLVKELKEKPSWFLNADERETRMEKRRLSVIISEMLMQMQAIRNKVYQKDRPYVVSEEMMEVWISKDVSIKLCYSLENVIDGLYDFYGYDELDEEKDKKILSMIASINSEWMDAVKNQGILTVCGDEFKELKNKLFIKMREFYKQYFKEDAEPVRESETDVTED